MLPDTAPRQIDAAYRRVDAALCELQEIADGVADRSPQASLMAGRAFDGARGQIAEAAARLRAVVDK